MEHLLLYFNILIRLYPKTLTLSPLYFHSPNYYDYGFSYTFKPTPISRSSHSLKGGLRLDILYYSSTPPGTSPRLWSVRWSMMNDLWRTRLVTKSEVLTSSSVLHDGRGPRRHTFSVCYRLMFRYTVHDLISHFSRDLRVVRNFRKEIS